MWFKKKPKPSPPIEHINADYHPAENIKPPGSWERDPRYHLLIKPKLLGLGFSKKDDLWDTMEQCLDELKELREKAC
jgi:hypothetical protein